MHEDTYTLVEDVVGPGEPGDDHHLVDYQTQELVSRLSRQNEDTVKIPTQALSPLRKSLSP